MEALQLQTFVEATAERVVTEKLHSKDVDRQFAVTKIPAHTHNGSDSLQVNFPDLINANLHSVVSYTTLTPAQVKALNTTPVQLVAQPGPKTVIIVDGITVRIIYSGTAYTGTHNMEFHYTDGSGQMVTQPIPAAFINSVSSAFYYSPPITDTAFIPVAGDSGNNGRIVAFVNTANPAAGNSQIIIATKYHYVPFNF